MTNCQSSLYRITVQPRYNEVPRVAKFVLYNEVPLYRSFFPYILLLLGVNKIVRYTEDNVIQRFVISRFHCIYALFQCYS